MSAATVRFEEAMEDAGFAVEHYHGRHGWHGPAVRCDRDSFQAVLAAASEVNVKVQWDSMGLGSIVYPVAGEPNRAECVR